MVSRILVAVVGIPAIILIVLYCPRFVLCAALAVLAALAGMELQQCVSQQRRGVMVIVSAVLPALTVLWYYTTADAPVGLYCRGVSPPEEASAKR